MPATYSYRTQTRGPQKGRRYRVHIRVEPVEEEDTGTARAREFTEVRDARGREAILARDLFFSDPAVTVKRKK